MSKVKISTRLEADHTDVRAVVSTTQDLSNPIYSPSVSSVNRMAKLTVDGLSPSTQYYYGIMLDGTLHERGRGQFRTSPAPNTAKNFTCAFASCADSGVIASEHSVFTTIKDLDPDFFIHMGDIVYSNIAENDIILYRKAYDQVFASEVQAQLYANVPTMYMWDDHDFATNDSNGTVPQREAARLAYRERVPHHTLPTGEGNYAPYYSFIYGRVRFIVTDVRSEKYLDSTNPTMFSQTQEDWFFNELLQPEPFKVWVNTTPWIGDHSTNTLDEAWFGLYYNHRTKIADFIKNNSLEGKVAMLSGDMHALAIDDGTNSDYATGGGANIPVFQAAPLNKTGSTKGGPWTYGPYINDTGDPKTSGNQYGVMNVTDDGNIITVEWKAMRDITTMATHTFTVS